jgi:hypothetical protein
MKFDDAVRSRGLSLRSPEEEVYRPRHANPIRDML